jgi:glycosyltransferase involved in cell wall biosynthesis
MKLSILIPVYNERYLVAELIRRALDAPLPRALDRELIVVDDGSTDGTRAILEELAEKHPEIVYTPHEKNQGKAGAIRTAIALASGEFCIFQDADLEYDPRDYALILDPLLTGDADVVYGSRFLSRERRRVLYFWHSVGNHFLTLLSNLTTGLNLTDMETCYKAFRTDLLKTIPIRSENFGLEPEITAKVAKRRFRVYEVPINYNGRTYAEGKKITWKDGFHALWVLLKYRLIDDLYAENAGARVLRTLDGAHHFNRWMADRIRPYVGHRVLEIGAGIGTLAQQFLPRDRYVAAELDPLHLDVLRNLSLERPYLEVTRLDAQQGSGFAPYAAQLDTILCLNVLEHLADPAAALRNVERTLRPGGTAIVLVPAGQSLYGGIDESVGHLRRYSREDLRAGLEEAGLRVEELFDFNRVGVPGWWLNGRVLGRREMPKLQLKLYDSLVWLWRRIDRFLPWPGLSLIAVARKPE